MTESKDGGYITIMKENIVAVCTSTADIEGEVDMNKKGAITAQKSLAMQVLWNSWKQQGELQPSARHQSVCSIIGEMLVWPCFIKTQHGFETEDNRQILLEEVM